MKKLLIKEDWKARRIQPVKDWIAGVFFYLRDRILGRQQIAVYPVSSDYWKIFPSSDFIIDLHIGTRSVPRTEVEVEPNTLVIVENDETEKIGVCRAGDARQEEVYGVVDFVFINYNAKQ